MAPSGAGRVIVTLPSGVVVRTLPSSKTSILFLVSGSICVARGSAAAGAANAWRAPSGDGAKKVPSTTANATALDIHRHAIGFTTGANPDDRPQAGCASGP